MDFRLTEEQAILRKAATDFVKAECSSDFVRQMEQDERGYTPELWRKMANLGWMALLLPEEYGGTGFGILDWVILLESMGAGCLPGPYLSTVLGAQAVLLAGNAEQKNEILPQVASGEHVMTLAYLEPGHRKYEPRLVQTKATGNADGYLLNGEKLFVEYALSADTFVVSARTRGDDLDPDGISLFLVPQKSAGLDFSSLTTSAGDKQCAVYFSDVHLDPSCLLGTLHHAWPVLDQVLKMGAIGTCALMTGGAQRVVDMTVAYAKERVQFGKAIGSFQAVQHHCANMLIDLAGSRFITYKAAWQMGQHHACDLTIAAAKAWVSDAYGRICALGHQIGAATAYIVEHDMTLYSRRAKTAQLAFGDAAYHRAQAARTLGLVPSRSISEHGKAP